MRGARSTARRDAEVATYPCLVPSLTALAFDPPPDPAASGRLELEQHLSRASKTYSDTRLTVALLSILVVPGTFLLARVFVPSSWSLAAAALAGSSLLELMFAQQARPHAVAAAFFTLALAAAIAVYRRGDALSYAAAGLAAGLTVASLHSGVALGFPLLAAHLLRGRSRALDPRFALAAAIAAACALAFYRFPGGDGARAPAVPRLAGSSLIVGTHTIELAHFDGRGLAIVARTLAWYEPVLLALAVLALAAWLRARRSAVGRADAPRRESWIVASFVLPYLAALALYGETSERFLLPVVPCLAVFGAWGARELASLRALRVAVPTAFGVGLALTAACSARLAWLRSRPDTLREVASWLEERLAREPERVFLSPIATDLPLARTADALAGAGGPRPRYYNVWSRYQAELPADALPPPRYDLQWMVWTGGDAAQAAGASRLDYFRSHPREVLARSGPGLYVVEDYRSRPTYAFQVTLQDALDAVGERVARFAPDDTGVGFTYQDDVAETAPRPPFAFRALTARAIGPVFEVWRVTPEQLAE
jgi:hypothetical protein